MIRSHKQKDPSRRTTSNLQIVAPEGLQYDPYQRACVEYCIARKDTLIGDEPGVGKTIEAIGVVEVTKPERVLIICPAFLKPNWRDEIEKWLTWRPNVVWIEGRKDAAFYEFTIINYELLKYYRDELRRMEWDVMVVDECHKLKSKRSDRTREVFGGVERDGEGKITAKVKPIPAKRRIFMTGTPILNGKPKELWPLIQAVDPEGLGSDWFHYAKRYCDLLEITRFDPAKGKEVRIGWKWDGATNLEEFQNLLRQKFMIRRLKSEVLTQLPEKRRMILPIETTGKNKKLVQEELKLFNEWARDRDVDLLDMPSFEGFSEAMKKIGLSMIEPTIEVAETELESVDKIVIMCYHIEVAEKIAEHFGPECVLITGNVPADERQGLVNRFQNQTGIRVVVGTIGACGIGFTMTKASVMLFAERDWVPGNVTQAEDRIHRRGQNERVIYKHLVRVGSLAERQVKMLLTKQEKNDRMLDVVDKGRQ